MSLPSFQFLRLPGRVTAAGQDHFWTHFLFTPDNREEVPFLFHVQSGANAFLLHGVIARQPKLPALVERFSGQPAVMVEVAPAFTIETEPTGANTKHLTVPVIVRRTGYRPPTVANTPPEDDGQAEMLLHGEERYLGVPLPRFSTNHHPVYCIPGTIIEREEILAGYHSPQCSPRARVH